MKKLLGSVGIAAAVVLAAICFIVLPDTVALQIGCDGKAANAIPKAWAILVPFGIALLGGVRLLFSGKLLPVKSILICAAGLLLLLAELGINLLPIF